jgi:hypothetical protein
MGPYDREMRGRGTWQRGYEGGYRRDSMDAGQPGDQRVTGGWHRPHHFNANAGYEGLENDVAFQSPAGSRGPSTGGPAGVHYDEPTGGGFRSGGRGFGGGQQRYDQQYRGGGSGTFGGHRSMEQRTFGNGSGYNGSSGGGFGGFGGARDEYLGGGPGFGGGHGEHRGVGGFSGVREEYRSGGGSGFGGQGDQYRGGGSSFGGGGDEYRGGEGGYGEWHGESGWQRMVGRPRHHGGTGWGGNAGGGYDREFRGASRRNGW